MSKIKVEGSEITIITQNESDYISLTDMVEKQTEGGKLIEKWITTKNTIEFLGIWEHLHNPDFNYPEFGVIKNDSGSNRFVMSVGQWVNKTNAMGIFAKAGRYGGTYAHQDIAFHFGMYISPLFNLLLVKEFQRLKEDERLRLESGWDAKRYLSKVNYKIHTEAVKEYLLPISALPEDKKWIVYAENADIINMAMFGKTAKTWKEENPQLALEGLNMRDVASTHQLVVLANLENYSSILIKEKISKAERFLRLRRLAIEQLKLLGQEEKPYTPLIANKKKHESDFDLNLRGLLSVPPPPKKAKE
jgi:hypothetical protein